MKRFVVIIAIIIASVAAAFGQEVEMKRDTIVNDTVVSYEIENIIGQTVYVGRGGWTEQLEERGIDLQSGVYKIKEYYVSGEEKIRRVIVK